MKVAIVGAGNGGQSAAADLTLRGHSVSLYDRFPEVIEPFRRQRRLIVSGAIEGEAVLDGVGDDLAATVAGAEVVLVSVPSYGIEDLGEPLGRALQPGQLMVLHPGGTGGGLRLRAIWDRVGVGAGNTLAETETLAYACRLESPGHPDVKAVKRSISMAVLPGGDQARAFELMKVLYPQTRLAQSVLETALGNLNPVIHPPIVLGNARAIEAAGPRFEFYRDGISASVATVIDGLDRERMALAATLGADALGLHAWVERAYAITGQGTEPLIRTMATAVYDGILGPDRMDSRYLSEDVPAGLVPWTEWARLAGVEMPLANSVIELASTINGVDYRREGRTLERMGLGGLDLAGMLRRVGA